MANGEFREPIVNDLVLLIPNLILSDFRRSTGRNIRLWWEKQIISIDSETRGEEEDNNGTGEVYGFITTGDSWRMFSYNGIDFQMTRKIEAVFEDMDQERELWMKEYSIVVDCMYGALSKGEDVVVG
ncbi:hypothetical protein BGX38DRAFT_1265312 [Terfezia claveryi]|nr:hypothetical protein BGX38DRAFT_1265312 [Terfezia claveryi]